jgi:hypothetical protein
MFGATLDSTCAAGARELLRTGAEQPAVVDRVEEAAYIKALESEKGIYNPTGIMPQNGPRLMSRS